MQTRSFVFLVLAIATRAPVAPGWAANIQAVETVPGYSHWNFMSVVLRVLMDRGHRVVAFTPYLSRRTPGNDTEVDTSAVLQPHSGVRVSSLLADHRRLSFFMSSVVDWSRQFFDTVYGMESNEGADAAGQRHRSCRRRRRRGRPVRSGHHRAIGFEVRVPSGRHARAACGVRDTHAHDHVHCPLSAFRTTRRTCPIYCTARHSGVPSQVGQHGRVHVQQRCTVVLRAHGPPATVRWWSACQTLRRVRQQPSHYRTRYTAVLKRHTRRWHTLGHAWYPATSQYHVTAIIKQK